jgi:hypothetical protein
MSGATTELFLARLYTDATLRERFLADPVAATADARLDAHERSAIIAIDRDGLALAAQSFARQRVDRSARPRSLGVRARRLLRIALNRLA